MDDQTPGGVMPDGMPDGRMPDGRIPGMPYGVPQRFAPPAKTRQDKFALVALVLGLVAMFAVMIPYLGIPASALALIFGILGRNSEIRRPMAIAGMAMGVTFLVLSVLWTILLYSVVRLIGDNWDAVYQQILNGSGLPGIL